MKRQLPNLFLLAITVKIMSCHKEPASKGFSTFYKLIIDGKVKSVAACGSSGHIAQYLKDTAIFTGFGCGGRTAGFYLKGQLREGVYDLGSENQTWYTEGAASYTTDSAHGGSLTIRTKLYERENGGPAIAYIEGELSFEAIDKNTGNTITVKNGKYRLERIYY